MADDKREFKGVWFPAEVWLDERLTALEKIILMEIDSLDKEDGCFASNEYLAKFCQCSQSKVSSAISKLKKLGYIRVKSFDGRKRFLESCMSFSVGQTTKKEKSAYQNLEEIVLEDSTSKSTNKHKRRSDEFQEAIHGFTDNSELQAAIWDFIEHRKQMKAPMSTRSLTLLLNRLNKLASDERTQVAILNEAIMNGWKSVYPLKTSNVQEVGPNGVELLPESKRDHILDGIL